MKKMGKKARYTGGRIACLYLVMMLVVLMTAGTVSAAESGKEVKTVDPVNQSDNYSAVLYDNTNGLPTAEANAIVQTSEGFIWIGSYAEQFDDLTMLCMEYHSPAVGER